MPALVKLYIIVLGIAVGIYIGISGQSHLFNLPTIFVMAYALYTAAFLIARNGPDAQPITTHAERRVPIKASAGD